MEPMLETDHRRPAGEEPGDLDRVLDSLGPAVHEKASLLMGPRSQTIEPLRQRDIGLVRRHRETDMSEPVQLLPHCSNHALVPVTRVHHPNTATEVDQPVTIRIGQDGSFRMDDGNGCDSRNSLGHRLGAPSHESAAIGSRYVGLEVDHSGHESLIQRDRRSLISTGIIRHCSGLWRTQRRAV